MLGQGFELLIWCSHHAIGIAFSDLTFVVDNRDREETRPVEVDIGVEEVSIELINQFSAPLGDIGISQLLAYH